MHLGHTYSTKELSYQCIAFSNAISSVETKVCTCFFIIYIINCHYTSAFFFPECARLCCNISTAIAAGPEYTGTSSFLLSAARSTTFTDFGRYFCIRLVAIYHSLLPSTNWWQWKASIFKECLLSSAEPTQFFKLITIVPIAACSKSEIPASSAMKFAGRRFTFPDW